MLDVSGTNSELNICHKNFEMDFHLK